MSTLLITYLTLLLQLGSSTYLAESKCTKGCPLALASYYVWQHSNITFIAEALNVKIEDVLSYNPSIPDKDRVQSGTRVNVPISCDCISGGEFLGHVCKYQIHKGDTYTRVAQTYYSNLTTPSWVQKFNSYKPNDVPDNAVLNVTVNCSCGNRSIDDKYGLFLTYPLRPEDDLSSVAQKTNSTPALLRSYNPNANFSSGHGLVFIPAKDKTGKYPPMTSSSAGLSGGAIAGICVAIVATLTLAAILYFLRRKKKREDTSLLSIPEGSSEQGEFSLVIAKGAAKNMGITVDKSVEFSYEELAQATDDFSMAKKIGAGGFGVVYYAELRGEKAAIKKMDMLATKEFFAEIHVLTRVHHFNLVRLIGYCVEKSLFLVYEYVESGNLSQHLRGSGRDPLSWLTRVRIALDSARGLEYIHEHTVPVYIHRDIKSANILIDTNFHAKVADFGLAKLTEVGAAAAPTRLVGTFGYMPPEYAQYGEASPKIDVYAFGVVLFELISAKEAVVRGFTGPDSKGLVGLFEDVLNKPDRPKAIRKLVDPRLEENYPLSSVLKMAELAKACTQDNPQLRPSMRSVVVALMTLSSATEEWDASAFAQ